MSGGVWRAERARKFGCVLGVNGERSELELLGVSDERSERDHLDILGNVVSGASQKMWVFWR